MFVFLVNSCLTILLSTQPLQVLTTLHAEFIIEYIYCNNSIFIELYLITNQKCNILFIKCHPFLQIIKKMFENCKLGLPYQLGRFAYWKNGLTLRLSDIILKFVHRIPTILIFSYSLDCFEITKHYKFMKTKYHLLQSLVL